MKNNTSLLQAIRILRDKQTGIVDELAWTTLKHAQEHLDFELSPWDESYIHTENCDCVACS